MNTSDDLDIVQVLSLVLPYAIQNHMKTECRTLALSGAQYYQEIIQCQNLARFREVARMSKETD